MQAVFNALERRQRSPTSARSPPPIAEPNCIPTAGAAPFGPGIRLPTNHFSTERGSIADAKGACRSAAHATGHSAPRTFICIGLARPWSQASLTSTFDAKGTS